MRRQCLGGVLGVALLAGTLYAGGPVRLIGLDVTDADARRVLDQPTLVRTLPPVRYLGTPRMTDWLLEHPPAAAALARHLHPPLERYHVRLRGDDVYEVDDLGALRGTLRRIANGPERSVYLCDGQFRSLGPLLALRGSMVFTLHYRPVRDAGKDVLMEVQPQLYLRLDNPVAHGLTKVLGPLLGGVIDRRFAGLAAATQLVAERLTRDPGRLYDEMRSWPDLSPADLEAFRTTFVREPTP